MNSVFFNNNLTTGIVAVNTTMLASGQQNHVIGVVDNQSAINKRIHKEFVDNANDIHGVVFPLISAVQRVIESNWCNKTPSGFDGEPLRSDDIIKIILGFGKHAIMGVPVIIHVQNKFFVFGDLNK